LGAIAMRLQVTPKKFAVVDQEFAIDCLQKLNAAHTSRDTLPGTYDWILAQRVKITS
jgi:hypothetical protein